MTIFLRAHDIGEPMPRGTLPASDLIPGDVIEWRGYPADILQVIHRKDSGTTKLVWGPDMADGVVVCSTDSLLVIGWFEGNVRV